MSAIVIKDLTKRMGKKKIFQSLNLEVQDGEFFALLGLDDAGKTTIARILFNYLKPAKGQVRIYDMDCTKDSKLIKESVSFVPEEFIFNENVKVSNLLKTTLKLHNLQNIEEYNKLIDMFNLNTRLKFSEMDPSEKKVFAIVNALITKPRLLILDEPSKYLSDEKVVLLFNHLEYLKQTEGLTVFMLTNNLVDAQRYCDRAAYLFDGIVKDIEYLNEKKSNDKLIRINNKLQDITPFTSIGAILLSENEYETIFYFDKDMNDLSQVISHQLIDDYTIENASLKDKIAAYYDENHYYETEVKFDKKAVSERVAIESQNMQKNDDESDENQNPTDTKLNDETVQTVESDDEEASDDEKSESVEVRSNIEETITINPVQTDTIVDDTKVRR